MQVSSSTLEVSVRRPSKAFHASFYFFSPALLMALKSQSFFFLLLFFFSEIFGVQVKGFKLSTPSLVHSRPTAMAGKKSTVVFLRQDRDESTI